MMNVKKALMLVVLCLMVFSAAVSAVTDPNIISGVVRYNPDGDSGDTEPNLVPGGLQLGVLSFIDRTITYSDVDRFTGIDFVQTCVDDKNNPNHELDVTVNKAGTLFLFIDNRVGDGVTTDPPTLTSVMTWVNDANFVDTGYTVNFSTPATVYAKPLAGAGTIKLYAQNDGDSRVMYAVAAIPAGWNYVPQIDGVPLTAQVSPGETLYVNATVSDDGVPGTGLAVEWSTVSAPEGATVGFEPNLVPEDVTISFSNEGVYTLKISVSDSEQTAEQTVVVTVAMKTFALTASDHCMACNDSNVGPANTRRTTISDVKNYNDGTNQRRRVGYYRYDIGALKETGKVFANCFLSWNIDKWSNPSGIHMYTYAIKEELDETITLNGLTWNTALGIDNSPTPPLNSAITIDTLEPAEISPLLMAVPSPSTLDVWVDTATYPGLDEALNADTDGSIVLMYVCYDPESNGYEICSPSHSRSLTIDSVAYKGIILRGNIAKSTWATNPNPAINTSQSTSLAQLSWTNPPAVGNLTCDVWIGTGEPNNPVGSGDGFTLLANDVTGNTASLAGYTLAVNTEYKWVVNVTDDGTGETTQGYVWTFNTNNAYPTVEMEKNFQYLWLNNDGDPASATAVINATASDDGFPNPTLTLLWEQVNAPEGVEVEIDPNNVEDITLTLPAVGTYVFQLSAGDGDLVGASSTQIFVGATPCEAAHAKPEYEANIADLDDNCYVDIKDFAILAENWLVCNPLMDAPCVP